MEWKNINKGKDEIIKEVQKQFSETGEKEILKKKNIRVVFGDRKNSPLGDKVIYINRKKLITLSQEYELTRTKVIERR